MTKYELDFEDFLRSHGIKNFGPRQDPMLLAIGRERDGVVNTMPPPRLWWRIIPTLHLLERLRAVTGPIRVTSGWRAPAYNEAVGGADNSLHKQFNAVDFDPVDQSYDVEMIEDIIVGYQGGAPHDRFEGLITRPLVGLGLYPNADFNHLDTRGLVLGMRGARWATPSTA